ncbi:tyrosine--tRNA ligase [Falsiroseomonas sp. E2-1-a20]|uniref:tyrosine--tRNA ligase n=1 Tax=Falsiroseomonas sp. E2-1-a20 TaxID=3239300 RepID=UPI003F2DD157
MTATQDFLHIARERGFIHQVTDAEGLAASGRVSAYVGFDCTADSLHVGHLLSIMLLRLLQRTGNRPVALMGGGTTKIGDPSFRDDARPLLDDAQIEANKAGIRKSFDSFLEFGPLEFGHGAGIMLDNAEWLDELRYIPFLREVGRHFSVNRMLTMDSVRLRLGRDQPLSFLEFNYMLLQSYDFLELHRRLGVTLQMGGSDQWGNIIMGADLVRRMAGAEAFGLTTPLLTTASGTKMGKTAGGAVWLNPDRLAPYGYWQFWRNVEDADVGRFLGLFTELPMDEVRRLGALSGAEVNEAKKILATEATALLHGRAAAETSAETARRAFEQGEAAETLPSHATALPAGIVDILAEAKLVASKSEARRLIKQNGVRLNDAPVGDEAAQVTVADLRDGAAKLSLGRKRHLLVRQAG